MKVLVTGGAGFVGSSIVDRLIDKNYEVCIIDNMCHGKKENINNKSQFYNIDIRDSQIINVFKEEKPDYVIHQAAQISINNSIQNPMEDADINILGTINLLEACKSVGVKKIVYPASAAVFGEPQYLPIDEKHPLDMISPYGVSKHTVEHYLSVYKELYGLEYVCLRYSNVYGARQDSSCEGGVVAIFFDKLMKNEAPIIYGDGEQIRDFIYIEDVAKVNLLALETEKSGVYNVCTNIKTSINRLFKCIKNNFNIEIEPIYMEERPGDIRHSYMTYNKIYNELGWKPEFKLEDGIDIIKNILLKSRCYH